MLECLGEGQEDISGPSGGVNEKLWCCCATKYNRLLLDDLVFKQKSYLLGS